MHPLGYDRIGILQVVLIFSFAKFFRTIVRLGIHRHHRNLSQDHHDSPRFCVAYFARLRCLCYCVDYQRSSTSIRRLVYGTETRKCSRRKRAKVYQCENWRTEGVCYSGVEGKASGGRDTMHWANSSSAVRRRTILCGLVSYFDSISTDIPIVPSADRSNGQDATSIKLQTSMRELWILLCTMWATNLMSWSDLESWYANRIDSTTTPSERPSAWTKRIDCVQGIARWLSERFCQSSTIGNSTYGLLIIKCDDVDCCSSRCEWKSDPMESWEFVGTRCVHQGILMHEWWLVHGTSITLIFLLLISMHG